MSVFEAALRALFADPNLTVDLWYRDMEGRFLRARGILRRPDDVMSFGSARLVSETIRLDVQACEIPNPQPDEQILIGEEIYLIQGAPRRDRERLIWELSLSLA